MSTTSGPHPDAATPPAARADAQRAPLRELGALMVLALLGQLLLGMANSFWLQLPDSGSGWGHAVPAGLLLAHIVLAAALLVLAVGIAVAAIRARDRTWRIASVVGAVGILAAAGAGTAFMSQTGDDAVSFAMAAGTAVALGAYALGLYQLPARQDAG